MRVSGKKDGCKHVSLVGSSVSTLPPDCDAGGLHPLYDAASGNTERPGSGEGGPHPDPQSDSVAGGSDASCLLSVGTPSLYVFYGLLGPDRIRLGTFNQSPVCLDSVGR